MEVALEPFGFIFAFDVRRKLKKQIYALVDCDMDSLGGVPDRAFCEGRHASHYNAYLEPFDQSRRGGLQRVLGHQ
jgi:hypothetical protein